MEALAFKVLLVTFALGVFTNLLTSALYDFSLGKLSFRSSEYPNLVGTWQVRVKLDGMAAFDETVLITGQLNRRFKGTYTSPAIGRLKDKGLVELEIRGRLLDHRTIRYVAQSKRKSHVDYVTGMAVISNDRQSIEGLSVSMGILTDEPTVGKVTFTRVAA